MLECCISKMTSSLTITFTGANSSVLQANFCPDIILNADSNYSCALLDLIIYNSENSLKKSDVIGINCDIISDSYINGEQNHSIHQFAPSNSNVKSKTFVEIPKHICYLPIKSKSLRSIQISIVNQSGELIKIDGNIICRINIKKDNN